MRRLTVFTYSRYNQNQLHIFLKSVHFKTRQPSSGKISLIDEDSEEGSRILAESVTDEEGGAGDEGRNNSDVFSSIKENRLAEDKRSERKIGIPLRGRARFNKVFYTQ